MTVFLPDPIGHQVVLEPHKGAMDGSTPGHDISQGQQPAAMLGILQVPRAERPRDEEQAGDDAADAPQPNASDEQGDDGEAAPAGKEGVGTEARQETPEGRQETQEGADAGLPQVPVEQPGVSTKAKLVRELYRWGLGRSLEILVVIDLECWPPLEVLVLFHWRCMPPLEVLLFNWGRLLLFEIFGVV